MKILRNKYGINLITVIVIFLLFIPAMLIEFLNDWILLYGLITLILYPIYLSLGNYFYFREKSTKHFLSNIHLVVFGTILNLGLCIPVMIEFFVLRGPEILMIIFLGFVSLILTIVGSFVSYFGIKSYGKKIA